MYVCVLIIIFKCINYSILVDAHFCNFEINCDTDQLWLVLKSQRELYVNTNAYTKCTLSYRLIIPTYTVRVTGFVMFSYRL